MLADDVAAAVAATPGLTAAQIALALDSKAQARQERAVSAALFANHGRFRCDRGSPPRWWLAESSGGLSESRVRGSGGPPPSNDTRQRSAPLELRSWQSDALDAWSRSGHRGVVEAVTGTGKTMVGVAAALDELSRRSQVLVLVPTVELQRQWVVELHERLPEAARIGRLGAGAIDSLGTHDVPFEAFMRALGVLAESNGEGGAVARGYRAAMLDRRRLLADTPAKEAALVRLAPAIGAADRAIVFTQSIAASELAMALLGGAGLRAGAVSSAVAAPARHDVLRRFEAGYLDVISAPRVLDEGIDVPAADLAVIAGASRSRRQMIQRMGRVLRRKPDARRARFAILCVEDTIEDPRLGAHGAFLDEVVDVADQVEWFPSQAVSVDASGVCEYLARSATTQPLTVGGY